MHLNNHKTFNESSLQVILKVKTFVNELFLKSFNITFIRNIKSYQKHQ